MTNPDRLVIPDILAVIMLDFSLLVVLGMNINQFIALRIVKRDFVKSAPTLGAVRLIPANHRSARQPERRSLLGVVDPANNNRLVRIPLKEIDDHFLSNARYRERTPTLTRPGM